MGIELRRRPKVSRLDGSHRCVSPSETREMLTANSTLPSILGETELIVPKDLELPVHFVQARLIPGTEMLDEVMGKGFSQEQSFCSAVMEAVERFSCSLFPSEKLMEATYEQIAPDAIDPAKFGVFRSGPYASTLPIDWVHAWNLHEKRSYLVPAMSGRYISRHLGHWYYRDGGEKRDYTFSDANGCASGNCIEEAISHGICEVVERDAITIWARNRCTPPSVEIPESTSNPYLAELIRRIQGESNLSLTIRYLTLDLDIHVFACLVYDANLDHSMVGYGAHLDPNIGLLRAATEMMQARALLIRRWGSLKQPTGFRGIEKEKIDYLVGDTGGTIQFSDLRDRSTSDLAEDIEVLMKTLEKGGLEVLVVDNTREDLAIPAVKVLIPGIQRVDWAWLFGNELLGSGSDRVFSVPHRLGLVDPPRRLGELDITQLTFQ